VLDRPSLLLSGFFPRATRARERQISIGPLSGLWEGLLLAYAVGQLVANLPIAPGGIGVVKGALSVLLACSADDAVVGTSLFD